MQRWVLALGLLCLLVILGVVFFPTGSGYGPNQPSVSSHSGGEAALTAAPAGERAAAPEEPETTEENAAAPTPDSLAAATVAPVTESDYWFTGYSYDEGGTPLAETTVTALLRKGRAAPRKVAYATSDANGYFAVELPSAGRYWMQAEPKAENLSLEEARVALEATHTAEIHNFTHHPAGGLLQGKVVDKETQIPVAGAEVKLGLDFGSKEWKTMQDWAMPSATSGLDGTFTLRRMRPGIYSLEATAKGYETFSPKSWEGRDPLAGLRIAKDTVMENLLVQMVAGGSVVVRVFDPERKPLANAEVEAVMAGVNLVNPAGYGNTDAKGEWRTDSVRKGKGVVQVKHEKYGLTVSDSFTTGTVEDPAIVTVVMDKAASVSGRVTLKNGQPATDHIVWAFSKNAEERIGNSGQFHLQTANTDADGQYRINNLGQGPYEIRANKINPEGQDPAARKKIALQAGENKTGVDLVMGGDSEGGESVRGKVVDQSGEPVKDILVMIHIYDPSLPQGSPGWSGTDNTNEAGEFEITGLAKVAKFHFSIWAEGYEKISKDLPMDGQYLNITLIKGGALRGVVQRSQDKQPIAGAELVLYSMMDLNFNEKTVYTEKDGRFEFPTQAPGLYRITAEAEGYALTERAEISVEAGKDAGDVLIEMDNGLSFLGQALAPDGGPVPGVSVALLSHRGPGHRPFDSPDYTAPLEAETASDANGVFEVLIDPQKPDTLILRPRDYAPRKIPLSVQMVRREPVPIPLTPGASVEGHVYDGEGKPRDGARVFFFDDPDQAFLFETDTGADGAYRIEHLPPMNLIALKKGVGEGESSEYKQVTLREGETAEVNFGDDSGATVDGTVTQSGQPLEGSPVFLQSVEQHVLQLSAVTDAAGQFTMKAVPPGNYLLIASLPDNRNAGMPYFADAQQNVQVTEQQKQYTINLDISKGEVEGLVKDAATGQPVAGVEIQPDYTKIAEADLNKYTRPATSDANGVFKTTLKAPGTYYMTAVKVGYELKSFEFSYGAPAPGAPAKVAVEVLLTPSETELEAHLFVEGQPLPSEEAHFSSKGLPQAFPSEPVPGQPGVFRVTGLPEGGVDLEINASGVREGMSYRERLDAVTVQKGVPNRLMINMTPIVFYVLVLSDPEGRPVYAEGKDLTVDLPDAPRFMPPGYGAQTDGSTSHTAVSVPAGPTRMILSVKGFKPIDFIPWNVAKPTSVGWRRLELQLER